MAIRKEYRRRPVRFLELAEREGWRLKVYGIRFQSGPEFQTPDKALVQAAIARAFDSLERPATSSDRYGVGFLIVHQGQDRNWVLLDWWYDSEILKQRLFSSAIDKPLELSSVLQSDIVACTWEMAVLGFERDAWVKTVLDNPGGPDFESYCAQHLNADV